MANYGYAGDINNSIGVRSAYPGGRTFAQVPPAANRFRTRTNSPGELGAMTSRQATMAAPAGSVEVMPQMNGGIMGKPSAWWITFLIIFVLFIWVARKYAPDGNDKKYGNILPSFYNGVFLTLYIVLILNVLKVFATKFKIPGLSDLILAA
jgi:hypothetical protein